MYFSKMPARENHEKKQNVRKKICSIPRLVFKLGNVRSAGHGNLSKKVYFLFFKKQNRAVSRQKRQTLSFFGPLPSSSSTLLTLLIKLDFCVV